MREHISQARKIRQYAKTNVLEVGYLICRYQESRSGRLYAVGVNLQNVCAHRDCMQSVTIGDGPHVIDGMSYTFKCVKGADKFLAKDEVFITRWEVSY
jgi:hypothetical protein